MTRLTVLLFSVWALLILGTAGSYLFAIWPEFWAKIGYLAAWKIVGLGIAPQGLAGLKLAAFMVLDRARVMR